jgi:MFS family permease
MTNTLERATDRSTPPAARRTVLGDRAAFALQVSILVLFLAASSAPTPLYAVYQAEWGFSPVTVTIIFGVYAVAVLAALLTVGSLSDHIGRRPVLFAAIGLQALALVVFATAEGVPALLAARIAQGLSTGAAVGALGAGLLDLNRTRGTIANGAGSIAGTAIGAIGSGLLVQFLPAPTHLIYLTLLGILVLQGIGVIVMPESSTRTAGALASLRPQLGLPPSARRPLLLAVPALVAVWPLAGFYGSLGPSLVRGVVGSNAIVLGGLGLFVLAASGAVTVLFVHAAEPRTVVLIGTSALIGGVGLTLLAIAQTSTVVFILGTAVAGVGFGAAFQGSLRSILPLAAAHQRAGVLSTIYVVCYLAMGLPAVVAGFVVVDGTGVLDTARGYGVVVMVLAATALLGAVARREAPSIAVEPAGPALACGQAD